MSRNMRGQGGQRPVFVDVSGRRQRRLRRAGAFGVLLAVGYVCVLFSTVLFSTVLGGPTTHSPFLSLPPVRTRATVGSLHLKPAPTASKMSAPRQPSVVGVALTVPVVMPTSSPAAGSAPTSGPDVDHANSVSYSVSYFVSHGVGQGDGQADGDADTCQPADQAVTMSDGTRCDPSA